MSACCCFPCFPLFLRFHWLKMRHFPSWIPCDCQMYRKFTPGWREAGKKRAMTTVGRTGTRVCGRRRAQSSANKHIASRTRRAPFRQRQYKRKASSTSSYENDRPTDLPTPHAVLTVLYSLSYSCVCVRTCDVVPLALAVAALRLYARTLRRVAVRISSSLATNSRRTRSFLSRRSL